MPEIVVKNLSAGLISLPVGQVPAKGVRSFNLDLVRLEQLKIVLAPMRERGHVDFWTNDAIQVAENLDASLRGKAESLNELDKRLTSLDALSTRMDQAIHTLDEKVRSINALHDKAESVDHLLVKASLVEETLAKSSDFDKLLGLSDRVEGLLGRTEDVDRALSRLEGMESLFLVLEAKIREASETVSELRTLRDQLSVRVATPLSEVLSDSSARLVSCSSKIPVEIPNLQIEDVPVGTWLATFECSLSSPSSATGVLKLMCGTEIAGERVTGILKEEGNAPFVMTELLRLEEPARVFVTWQADANSIRMTTRRVTLLKVAA